MTWFGAGLIVQPKLIDVEKEILKIKDLVDYPALLATVCIIGGLYIIAMIWARRQDNNDILKVKTLCMLYAFLETCLKIPLKEDLK